MLGTFVFFWAAPATVSGLVPWALTRWSMKPPFLGAHALRGIGLVLLIGGGLCIVECFARFALRGLGTPAPLAPTRFLVSSGLYRHIRNPMYVAVVSVIEGQGLLLGSPVLVAYGAVLWIVFHAFVTLYEEPTLHRQFGSAYDEYRTNVPRWWPRKTAWQAPAGTACR